MSGKLQKLTGLLSEIKSYSSDTSKDGKPHPILDHPEKYEFNKQDHHWHLKELAKVNRKGEVVKEPALFDQAEIGTDEIPSEEAAWQFNHAKKTGWGQHTDPDSGEITFHAPSKDVVDKASISLALPVSGIYSGKKPAHPDLVSSLGETLGFLSVYKDGKHLDEQAPEDLKPLSDHELYYESVANGALKGAKATGKKVEKEDLPDFISKEFVEDYIAPGGKTWDALSAFGYGLPDNAEDLHQWLQDNDFINDEYPYWEEAQDAHAEAVDAGVEESVADDWKNNHVNHPSIESVTDLENWFITHDIDIDDEDDWDYAAQDAESQGIAYHIIESWKESKSVAGLGDVRTSEDLLDWAENSGYDPRDFSQFTYAMRLAEKNGVSKDILSETISESLNKSKSEGGVVEDRHYKERIYDPVKTRETILKEIGSDASTVSEALGDPDMLRRLIDTAASTELKRRGHQSWATKHQTDSEMEGIRAWLAGTAKPHEVARFAPDVGRYIDKTTDPETARLVLSDAAAKAKKWVDAGKYQYKRFSTVPQGDYNTRTERENYMRIGRVNYAALGFDAPLPPKLDFSQAPVEDLESGEVAEFRTQGYGDTRFVFRGVEGVSHAINDTYFDSTYCPDGGYRALLPNALSFARGQSDYRYIQSPSMSPVSWGPNFMEMHPKKDLSVEDLETVHMYSPHVSDTEGPGEMTHDQLMLLINLLHGTNADIVMSPNGNGWYHMGTPVASSTGSLTTLTSLTREREARAHIDGVQEKVYKELEDYGFSDAEDRVHFYLPTWYRS